MMPDRTPTRIGPLLDTYGPDADRILRRYGLYCSGCHHSTAESIEMAGRHHGVDVRRIDALVRELTRLCEIAGRAAIQVAMG